MLSTSSFGKLSNTPLLVDKSRSNTYLAQLGMDGIDNILFRLA